MNKKFIITFASFIILLDWILVLVLQCCPDHYLPTDPPPGPIELSAGYALLVLAFPLLPVVYFLKGDPPCFPVSGTLLFFLGGLVWGAAADRLRMWRQRACSHQSPS